MEVYGKFLNRESSTDDTTIGAHSIYVLHIDDFHSKALSKIIRKKGAGTGDSDLDYHEIDNENVYVPTSGHCFTKCVSYIAKRDVADELEKVYKTSSEKRNKKMQWTLADVPTSSVKALCKSIGLSVSMYNATQKNDGNVLYCHQGHYVVLKKFSKSIVDTIASYVVKVPRVISEYSTAEISNKVKYALPKN